MFIASLVLICWAVVLRIKVSAAKLNVMQVRNGALQAFSKWLAIWRQQQSPTAIVDADLMI
jgi:hypothetical protein